MKITADLSISLDGFAAGVGQTRDLPFGEGVGERLHRWMFEQGGRPENAAAIADIGAADAYVMGRNMFGPIRGEWEGDWRGWWGDNPPYHKPVFVLTHYERESLEMEGGTTFHFVTDGIASALAQAKQAAGDDGTVAIAGGARTINQYLEAGWIDELRLHVVPITIGRGERLFDGVRPLTLEPLEVTSNELVTHTRYRVVR